MHERSKPELLGLPCVRCRAYYDANLTTCPICKCTERVQPTGNRQASFRWLMLVEQRFEPPRSSGVPSSSAVNSIISPNQTECFIERTP
jgi:hypothetical protein